MRSTMVSTGRIGGRVGGRETRRWAQGNQGRERTKGIEDLPGRYTGKKRVVAKAEPGAVVETVTSASLAAPISVEAVVSNPTYVLGGIVACLVAAGGALAARGGSGGSSISRLMQAAEVAEETWGRIKAEEQATLGRLQENLTGLDEDRKAVDAARRALEEAEAQVKRREEDAEAISAQQQELRVKSAEAWIENWRANQKLQDLQGTLRVNSSLSDKKKGGG
ncbi:hypothetical protein HOP50_02g19260 [Chloropicon primus]|uniref:Uncharacterized protein n=1 Tax=Chloropicon primus TaxID=1764295 RepID=A0A5B8MGE4_9CHLO|nr:hypothetical protein A3770_02p19290 [Chloropicon primus]UPQ98620.1 hypothetical protein HOP50_02g19260 [Chloropicon primus]|eukprot:QDZ19411.1 hypothetical protein A3770_02p19290 [Chloropicon primus]